MADTKKLLEIRKQIKRKKPFFARQDAHKKRRLGSGWRRPKGLHSKVRLCKKGYREGISKGYRSPLVIRGFHKKGLKEAHVSSLEDINKIKEGEGIIIKKGVGLRKRAEIVKRAVEMSIKILNIKDTAKFLNSVDELLKKKKEEKEEKKSSKEKKKKEKERKAEEKKKEENNKKDEVESKKEGVPDKKEDIEKEKKKEIEKVLTKREV